MVDNAPGIVTGREIRKNRDGDHGVLMLQIAVTEKSDVRAAELMTQHGIKSSPAVGAKVATIGLGRAWRVAVAVDDLLDPGVSPGELRLYSTASDGSEIVVQLYCKADGTLEITADTAVTIQAPDIQATADNTITAQAADIQATADNNITAQAGTKITGTAPDIELNSNVVINGTLQCSQGFSAGGGATISGGLSATGDISSGGTVTGAVDVIAAGKSTKGHAHSDPQGGNTGPPN